MTSPTLESQAEVEVAPDAREELRRLLNNATFRLDMRRFVWKNCWSQRQNIDDIVQEVFKRGWENVDAVKGPGAIKSWLFGVARFVITEKIRKPQISREVFFSDLKREDEEEGPLDEGAIPSEEPNQEERFGTHEILAQVRERALRMHGVEAYCALRMQANHGLQCPEIGEILDKSPGAVRQTISRLRRSLIESFKKEKKLGLVA